MIRCVEHEKSFITSGQDWHSAGPGLEVIKLDYSLRLKIKRNDWLLADTCENELKFYNLEAWSGSKLFAKAISRWQQLLLAWEESENNRFYIIIDTHKFTV